MLETINNLEELWRYVNKINNNYFPENKLMPILGGGQTNNPFVMFVFINPTERNISSNKNWNGLRAPFIGLKHIWNIFYQANLIDEKVINKINFTKLWDVSFANEVYNHLKEKELYFTNIVKWTGHNAELPASEKIKLFLPILKKEIEIIKPKYIVTFGLIPFKELVKENIKLKDFFSDFKEKGLLKIYNIKVNSFEAKIIPCYFPVGRGNPKRAIEILKSIKNLKESEINVTN